MKILFLGEPSSPNTMNWVNALRELGCEVILASVRCDEDDDTALSIGNPALPPRLRVLSGVLSLKKMLKEIKPDILLAYRITSYGYLAAKTGFHPLVLAAQNEKIVFMTKKSPLRELMLGRFAKFAIKNADLIHSWSDNITEGLKKFGADEDKILTLHRGVATEEFAKIAKIKAENFNFNPAAPQFVSTRSLFPEYRIDELIRAFNLLLKRVPGAELHIVGDGSERENLKKLAEKLEINENIHFYGRVDRDRMLEVLRDSDIYISIIETEGMSSSLIEAVAAGLLPIVFDMPASRIIVDDKNNGFLVRQLEPQHIAEVMKTSVASFDELHQALLDNSAAICENFNVAKNQQKFIEEYHNLIAGRM